MIGPTTREMMSNINEMTNWSTRLRQVASSSNLVPLLVENDYLLQHLETRDDDFCARELQLPGTMAQIFADEQILQTEDGAEQYLDSSFKSRLKDARIFYFLPP